MVCIIIAVVVADIMMLIIIIISIIIVLTNIIITIIVTVIIIDLSTNSNSNDAIRFLYNSVAGKKGFVTIGILTIAIIVVFCYYHFH